MRTLAISSTCNTFSKRENLTYRELTLGLSRKRKQIRRGEGGGEGKNSGRKKKRPDLEHCGVDNQYECQPACDESPKKARCDR